MKDRTIALFVALVMTALMSTACNKTTPPINANVSSAPAGTSNSSSSAASGTTKRFVGTWVEEDRSSDQGTRFTEDGKVIEVSSGKQVGNYTASGDDKAAITIAEGGAGSATLESDTRMKMMVGKETVFLRKK